MTLRDDLIAAKKLIEDPADWKVGAGYGPTYCAQGAVSVACGPYKNAARWDRFGAAIDALEDEMPSGFFDLYTYNDNTTHDKIMSLFNRAIANAEQADA